MCYVTMFRPNKRSNLKPQCNNKNNVNIPKQQSFKRPKPIFVINQVALSNRKSFKLKNNSFLSSFKCNISSVIHVCYVNTPLFWAILNTKSIIVTKVLF